MTEPDRGGTLRLARVVEEAGGIPAHGNQHSGRVTGRRPGFGNPGGRQRGR